MRHIVYIALSIFFGLASLISFWLAIYLKDIFFILIGVLLVIITILIFLEVRKTKNDPFSH